MANDPVNIFEYEAIAREKLDQGHYDFIAGAATDEITLRRTRTVLDSINLRPKMLTDISQRDLSTTVLGQRISFPSCSTRLATTRRPTPTPSWPPPVPPERPTP